MMQPTNLADALMPAVVDDRATTSISDAAEGGASHDHRADRGLTALQRTIDVLRRLPRAEDFVPATLKIVAEAFGAVSCGHYEIVGRTIFLRYWWHEGAVLGPTDLPRLSTEQLQTIRRLASGFTVPASHLGVDVAQHLDPLVLDHRELRGDVELQRFALSMGWVREINAPFFVDGRNVGSLVVYRGADPPFDASEIALAAALSRLLSLATQVTELAGRERAQVVETERAEAMARAAEEREAALARQLESEARANTALQETIDAVSRLNELDDLIPAVLQVVSRAFGVGDCSFFDWPLNGPIRLRHWVHEGRAVTGIDLARILPFRPELVAELTTGFEVPDSYFGRPNRERTRASRIDHVRGTSIPAFDEWAVGNGFARELNVPLVIGGQNQGALVIYRHADEAFEPAEVALAERLAQQLAMAVAATRVAEEARRAAAARLVAEQRAAELAKANAAIARALDTIAAGPMLRAPEIMFAEVARAAGASAAYWFEYDAASETLEVTLRFEHDRILDGPAPDEPALFRAPFRTDVTRAFELMSQRDDLLKGSTHLASADLWPGVVEWHERRGRTEHLAYVVRMGAEVLGVIGLAFEDRDCMTPAAEQLVRALSNHFGLALRMSRLALRAEQAAVAREQERAARDRAQMLERVTAAMRYCADALGETANTQAVIEQALLAMSDVLEAHGVVAAGVLEYLPASRAMKFRAYVRHGVRRPLEGEWLTSGWSIDDPQMVTPWSRITSEPFVWGPTHDETVLHPYARPMHEMEGGAAVAYVPLKSEGEVVGFIGLTLRDATPLSAQQIWLTQALASQVFLALQMDRVSSAARVAEVGAAVSREREHAAASRLKELTTESESLQKLIDEVAGLDSLASFIPRALHIAAEAFGAAAAGFFEHVDGVIYLRFWLLDGRVYGPTELSNLDPEHYATLHELAAGFSVPPEYLDGDFASRAHTAIIDHGTPRMRPHFDAFAMAMGWRWELNVPLVVGERNRGDLVILRSAEFSREDASLATSLGKQVALAMQASRLADRERKEAEEAAILTERNRIAREIHDTLAQAFTAIGVQLEAAQELSTSQPEVAKACLGRIASLAAHGLRQARRSVYALDGQPSADHDLVATLRAIVEAATLGTRAPARLEIVGTPTTLPARVAHHVVRVAQEALANAQRHAHAKAISIELCFEPTSVRLRVSDDGAGFDTTRIVEGLGLGGMRERAVGIGGALRVVSAPGSGTTIVLDVPTGASW
jgi:signal transduction histidine kinase